MEYALVRLCGHERIACKNAEFVMVRLCTGGIKDSPSDGEWKGWGGLCLVVWEMELGCGWLRRDLSRKEKSVSGGWLSSRSVCTAGLLVW